MTNYKEKITTSKTIKTLLFAGLIMTLMIPVAGMNVVEAESDEKIPQHALIKRDAQKWISQYHDQSKFNNSEKAIQDYVSEAISDNKWNRVMAKEHIRAHNFDTLIGQEGAGLQVLLVDVQNQKDIGTYAPTPAELRYHEWAAEKYPNPKLPVDVKPGWVKQIIASHNNFANHGNVPAELSIQDPTFWIMTANESMCSYESCTPESPPIDPITAFITDYVLPKAYALDVWHVMNGYIYTHSCVGSSGGCMHALDQKSGTGTLTASKTTARSYDMEAIVYGSNCGPYHSTETNTIDGHLSSGVQSWYYDDSSYNTCAVLNESEDITNNPGASFFATWSIESETTI